MILLISSSGAIGIDYPSNTLYRRGQNHVPMTRGEERGVAPVIGFILVFSFLIIAFTIYQGVLVPDQNRQAEFDHNQIVQDRLQEIRNAIVAAATTGTGRSVTLPLGADYPTRTLARNLGFSGGMLRTTNISDDTRGIMIHNISPTDEETTDYFGASGNDVLGPFPSDTVLQSLVYEPVYSFYSDAPSSIYENTLAYNQFDDINLTLTDQLIVDGDQITLVALVGDIAESGSGTVTVDPDTISGPVNRIPVRRTGSHVNITVPTGNISMWEEMLSDEPNATVKALTNGRVSLHLNRSTYQLGLALVAVGDGHVPAPGAHYVTDVDGDESSVPENSTRSLVVEVRDRYNNPVANANVTARIEGPNPVGTFESTNGTVATTRSDATGRARFVYNASLVESTREVDVNASIGNTHPREWVTFDLRVLDTGVRISQLPPFRFLSIVRAPPDTVASGSTHLITVDVRNESHVPVNETIIANVVNKNDTALNGTFADPYVFANRSRKVTGSDGQATFNFTAPATLDAHLQMTFNVTNTTNSRGNISLGVNVSSSQSGDSDSGETINPDDIRLIDATISSTNNNGWVHISLENTGPTTSVARARYQFYFADSTGSTAIPDSIELNETGQYVNLRGPFVDIDPLQIPNGSSGFCVDFFEDADGSGDFNDVEQGDFFVLSLTFTNGQSGTYFVAPRVQTGTVPCP